LYPFFDLDNVPIKSVKTDLPFIVSVFVEYPYYRKIGGPALGHRWELQPSVPERTQFQEIYVKADTTQRDDPRASLHFCASYSNKKSSLEKMSIVKVITHIKANSW
jgi:hypothetical protein